MRVRNEGLRRKMLRETAEFLESRLNPTCGADRVVVREPESITWPPATSENGSERSAPTPARAPHTGKEIRMRRIRIAKWMAAAVISLVITTFSLRVHASTTVNGQVQYMSQAIANIMAASKTVDSLSAYGYSSGVCVLGGYLTRGATVDFTTDFHVGHRYVILAGGDFDATDMDADLSVQSNGRLIATDHSVGPYAVLTFTADTTQRHVLRVKLHASDASGSFVAAAILEEGGVSLPISSLAEAGANLMNYCNFVMQGSALSGYSVGFESSPNQWALFGSILRTGESSRVFNLHPGAGRRLFLAAGDSDAEDIDLVLDANAASVVLASDWDRDQFPLIDWHTFASSDYGISTKMYRSTNNRPALVLTAVLSVR